MALLTIPFRGSSARPSVRQRVTLDGVTLEMLFGWNGREGRWFVTLLDGNGDPISAGRKLVVGWRPFRRVLDARLPGGRIGVLDRTGTGIDPGLDDFASGRCELAYLPAADVAAAGL